MFSNLLDNYKIKTNISIVSILDYPISISRSTFDFKIFCLVTILVFNVGKNSKCKFKDYFTKRHKCIKIIEKTFLFKK